MSRAQKNMRLYGTHDPDNPGQKEKSKRQVRYLLSRWSPLTSKQKAKLKRELHSGAVKVKG